MSSVNYSNDKLSYLRSEFATAQFAFKGQRLEASKAIEPVIEALEAVDAEKLPRRISVQLKEQLEQEIDFLKRNGLKRVIRITGAAFCSYDSNDNAGFVRWIDLSREWRECQMLATVLEQYIDVATGKCILESYDEDALITIHQSRHVNAGKSSNSSKDGVWQLDSFHLDMHKSELLGEAPGPTDSSSEVAEQLKNAAAEAAIGGLNVASMAVERITEAWDYADEVRARNLNVQENHDNYLGAVITVILLILLLIVTVILALPWFIRAALGVAALVAIAWGVVKYLKATDQTRKRKKIARFSDGYLLHCINDAMRKRVDAPNLVNFGIDDINIESVANDEHTTTIEASFTVIRKLLEADRSISLDADDVVLKLRRSRNPEKKRKKAKLEVEFCPSCGAKFEPDEHKCCSNCGYGIKLENFVWREVK